MKGLVLEGIVIVLSILIAFFLEGWRDDREVREEVQQALANVQRELDRNRELVALEVAALDRHLPAGNALVALLDGAGANEVVVVPDTLAWITTGWNLSFSPSLGAVDALIASGRLAQIENAQLRLGLAGLRDLFNDALEEELSARQIVIEQIAPLLGGRIQLDYDIGAEFFAHRGRGLTPQERVRDLPFPSRGGVEFPTDLRVRNAIVFRLGWLTSARAEFDLMQAHLRDLSDLLAEEVR